mgnify:CR=1 FL=1
MGKTKPDLLTTNRKIQTHRGNLGIAAGQRFRFFLNDTRVQFHTSQIEILISNAKRGEYTDSMRIDQYSGRPSDIPVYERFGADNSESCIDCKGTVESKQFMRFSVYRKLNQKRDLSKLGRHCCPNSM